MKVLICYDVGTTTQGGARRLREIARACADFGQRVQYSVFECSIGRKQWAELRLRLLSTMSATEDSVRVYFLTEDVVEHIQHYGIKKPRDLEGPLIA